MKIGILFPRQTFEKSVLMRRLIREIRHRDIIKIVATDIARMVNAGPYSKGGHRDILVSVFE